METKNYYSFFSSNEIKLKNQKIGKIICINIFRAVKNTFGETFLCYNTKYNRTFYANSQLKGYLNKMKPELQTMEGYYFKNSDLCSIVEFRIKSIKEDNDQVELEFIKQKMTRDTSEVLDLSDSEMECLIKTKNNYAVIV